VSFRLGRVSTGIRTHNREGVMDILDEIFERENFDIPRHEDVLREERDEMDERMGREDAELD